MTDPNKKYETEFTFSFEKFGESINKALSSLSNEEIKTGTFTEPIGTATSAVIHLNNSIGRVTLRASDDPATLFHAEAAYIGNLTFTTAPALDDPMKKLVTLATQREPDLLGPIRQTLGSIGRRADLHWNVWLGQQVPLRLEVEGGIGPIELDLTQLLLRGVNLDSGIGATVVRLPSSKESYHVEIESGVGGVTVFAPSATPAVLDIEGGVGSTVLHLPENAQVKVNLEGGVGGTTIHAAAGVAMRITAEIGIGGVTMPHTMRQIEKNDDNPFSQGGIWESEGFALSGHQTVLRYEGGIGALRVVQTEII
ncbi:MAG: hypothetical protein MUF87_10785 [Anaerolineae bacterium]|jgi:hypothetical protein|nr:hypothetical protein [Anaerolineae bacterium]